MYVGTYVRAFEILAISRSQSYDFWIYNYNASIVVGKRKYLSFQNALCYSPYKHKKESKNWK
jgi:hypothetical protein